MDIDTEIENLKRRVIDLEVAVHALSGQFRSLQPELQALKAEATRGFDATDIKMDRIVQRLDTMNTQVWSLRDDLPVLLRQALGSSPNATSDNSN